MTPQKEFKIASFVLLALAVLDVLQIALGYFADGSLVEGLSTGAAGFLIAIFAVVCLLALAKFYMGITGLRYCAGKGKGTLHIRLATTGVVIGVISLIIGVVDMMSGTGTFEALIDDATSIGVIYWYLTLAKKNLA